MDRDEKLKKSNVLVFVDGIWVAVRQSSQQGESQSSGQAFFQPKLQLLAIRPISKGSACPVTPRPPDSGYKVRAMETEHREGHRHGGYSAL
jgi:hypothetical protein